MVPEEGDRWLRWGRHTRSGGLPGPRAGGEEKATKGEEGTPNQTVRGFCLCSPGETSQGEPSAGAAPGREWSPSGRSEEALEGALRAQGLGGGSGGLWGTCGAPGQEGTGAGSRVVWGLAACWTSRRPPWRRWRPEGGEGLGAAAPLGAGTGAVKRAGVGLRQWELGCWQVGGCLVGSG